MLHFYRCPFFFVSYRKISDTYRLHEVFGFKEQVQQILLFWNEESVRKTF